MTKTVTLSGRSILKNVRSLSVGEEFMMIYTECPGSGQRLVRREYDMTTGRYRCERLCYDGSHSWKEDIYLPGDTTVIISWTMTEKEVV